MKRVLSLAAALVIATTGTVLAVAAPAQAAPWYCPASVGCFYENSNGGGAILTVGPGQGCHNAPSGWNDRASSVRNNTGSGFTLRFWKDANCSSSSWSVIPGSQGNMAGGGGTSFPFPNDGMSSFAVYPR